MIQKPALVPANSVQFHEISQLRREISVLVEELQRADVSVAPKWFQDVAAQVVGKCRLIHDLQEQVVERQLEFDPITNRDRFVMPMQTTFMARMHLRA